MDLAPPCLDLSTLLDNPDSLDNYLSSDPLFQDDPDHSHTLLQQQATLFQQKISQQEATIQQLQNQVKQLQNQQQSQSRPDYSHSQCYSPSDRNALLKKIAILKIVLQQSNRFINEKTVRTLHQIYMNLKKEGTHQKVTHAHLQAQLDSQLRSIRSHDQQTT